MQARKFAPVSRRRPTTQGGRDARSAASRELLGIATREAEARGWVGCGDLVTSALRRSPFFKLLPDTQRFAFSYVVSTSGCWDWVASKKAPSGYGQYRFRRSNWNAHRVAYTLYVGEIPDGLVLDHTCLNKGCVNPKHLEPVTGTENARRYAATITHCPRGHPRSLYRTKISCRQCHNERTNLALARRQVAAQAQRPGRVRLLEQDIEAMRALRTQGMAVKTIAAVFGVTPKYASRIITGSRQRRRRYTGPDAATRRLLEHRSGGQCEFVDCRAAAEHTHHRKPRRAGGSRDVLINLPANLIRLCGYCHAWIESNRLEALAMGLLLHDADDPSATPVVTRAGLIYLDNAGGYADNPPDGVS